MTRQKLITPSNSAKKHQPRRRRRRRVVNLAATFNGTHLEQYPTLLEVRGARPWPIANLSGGGIVLGQNTHTWCESNIYGPGRSWIYRTPSPPLQNKYREVIKQYPTPVQVELVARQNYVFWLHGKIASRKLAGKYVFWETQRTKGKHWRFGWV